MPYLALVALSVHLLGVAALFVAAGIEIVVLRLLGRAADRAQLGAALACGALLGRLFPLATALLVISGSVLTVSGGWHWSAPWLALSIVLVVALSYLGERITATRIRAIARATFAAPAAPIDAALDALRHDPVLVLASHLSLFGGVAIVVLMAMKPSLLGAFTVVAAAALAAFASSRRAERRAAAAL